MTTPTIPQTVLFPDLFDKPIVATFDRQHASSDGGAVLLKAAERVYGLVAGFARCLVDRRELGKIRHTLTELLGQRIFGIACGHPDGNDADHLADDPIHKLLLGRDPVAGEALASQPTISRFENGVGASALYALGRELAMRVIERHQRRLDGRARRITIDLDPTDDATHGAQQLTFFNGHYDSWCYLPLLAFLTFDQEREQYLCAPAYALVQELLGAKRDLDLPRALRKLDLFEVILLDDWATYSRARTRPRCCSRCWPSATNADR